MSLFKFFKKKQTNKLEELLRKAVDDPTYMAEFLKGLLTEKLLVITDYNEAQERNNELTNDRKIGIFRFDDGCVPIFTSIERVFDENVFKKDVKTLQGNGEYLFKLLSGLTLKVNPYSQYTKELTTEQVERLLNGTYFTGNLIQTAIAAESSVTLSQPETYPTEIVKSLIILFSGKPDVTAAYLGWIYNSTVDEPAHYIFAIETTGEMINLSSEAIYVAKRYLPPNDIIDFVQINRSHSISAYFINSTKPFYVKVN